MLTASVWNKNNQKTLSLWESLCAIVPKLAAQKRPVVAFTGAGGKTSWIYALVQELQEKGKRVLIVTTTKMYRPRQWGIIDGNLSDIERGLSRQGIVVAGKRFLAEKITYIGDELLGEAKSLADVVLVEADGARRMPLKITGPEEPVIPPGTTAICAVVGLRALGQPLGQACFRWNQTNLTCTTIITPTLLQDIWQTYCLDVLRQRYNVPIIPVIHQADTATLQNLGRQLLQTLGESGIVSTFPPALRDGGYTYEP